MAPQLTSPVPRVDCCLRRVKLATMGTWIALLRGINVGGRNMLPMKRLAALLEAAGCAGVRTYIQSGNVVFAHPARGTARLEKLIADVIKSEFGFSPQVMVLSAAELAAAAEANPWLEANDAPTSLHVYFLASEPAAPDLAAMKAIKRNNECFVLRGRVFYLFALDGVGQSKLAERAERLLGVAATARNWRTVTTLVEMAAEKAGGAIRGARTCEGSGR